MDSNNPHPVLVFYNFHSVPMPLTAVEQLFSFVTSNLPGEPNRFIFACDVRRTPQDVLDTVESVSQCEIEHFSACRVEHLLTKRIARYTSLFGDSRGTVALITGSENATNTVKVLRENGWDVVVFHPPGTSKDLFEAASKLVELPIHTVSESSEDENGCTDGEIQRVADLIKKEMTTKKEEKAEIDNWGVPIASEIRLPKPASPFSPFGNGFEARNPRAMPPQQTKNPFAPQNGFDRPNPFNKNPFDPSSGDSFSPRRPGKGAGKIRGGFEVAAPGETPMRQPGLQCHLWEDKIHMKKDFSCQLYHPRKVCRYFPDCKLTAEVCFYAHPFCSDGGECACEGDKNPQLNHIRS